MTLAQGVVDTKIFASICNLACQMVISSLRELYLARKVGVGCLSVSMKSELGHSWKVSSISRNRLMVGAFKYQAALDLEWSTVLVLYAVAVLVGYSMCCSRE
mmetsp:Transcript_61591/g.132859  ORF Transcript_61591/g.132859 Transcript_61591/m.132859 type:complete len:102 (+) Transcript_61591:1-306(+)